MESYVEVGAIEVESHIDIDIPAKHAESYVEIDALQLWLTSSQF